MLRNQTSKVNGTRATTSHLLTVFFFFFFFLSQTAKIITRLSPCRRSGSLRVNSASLCLHGKYLGAGHYCHILLSDCKEVPIKQIREEAEGLIEASNERPGRELG